MNHCELDHIVIAAANLEQGARYVQDLLGVDTVSGGVHQTQGTHNRLLGLGPECYLEVIAIDPHGNQPDHPRWFDLDNAELQNKITETPSLITWAARVADIEQTVKIYPYDQCEIHDLSRGDLYWRAALNPDGRLLEGGTLPLTIQWQVEMIPSKQLPDSGCRIHKLELHHPDSGQIQQKLTDMGLESPISFVQSIKTGLSVELKTPNGFLSLVS